MPDTPLAPRLAKEPAVRRLLLLTLLGFTGFAATLASLPWWAVHGGASAAAAGLVTTVMLAVTVATQFAVPAIVHRFGVGPTLALGLVALGAPSPLYLLSNDLRTLVAVSVLRGAGFAVLTVVGSTLTALLAPPGRHGELVGLYGLAIAVPHLVVVPGTVALAQNVGFWPVTVLATLPVLAVPLALAEGRPRRVVGGSEPAATARHRGGQRAAARASMAPSFVLLVVTLAGGGVLTYVPIERPDGWLATVALALLGVTQAVARWRAGSVADRFGTRLLLPATLVVGVVGLGMLSTGLVWSSATLVLLGSAMFGVTYGAVQNLTLVIAVARAGKSAAATASAVWNAAFDAGIGTGAVVVGGLAATGMGVPAALGLCAVLIAATLPVGRAVTGPPPGVGPDAVT